MKKAFFLLFISLAILQLPVTVRGQTPVFTYGDTSFTLYMKAHVTLDEPNICNRSLILVRFKVDSSGKVVHISFSKGTDSLIRTPLQYALESTGGKWTPAVKDLRSVESDFLILPCLIAIENGCNQQKIDAYFAAKDSVRKSALTGQPHLDSLRSASFNRNYSNTTLNTYFASREYESMWNLFIFDDQFSSYPVNATVLPQLDFIYIH